MTLRHNEHQPDEHILATLPTGLAAISAVLFACLKAFLMSEKMHNGSGMDLRGLRIRIAIPAWRLIGRGNPAHGQGVSQQEIRSLFRDELQDLRTWRRGRKPSPITGQRTL